MELRPYQSASIESLRDGFKAGHRRQVLCAATGAGKSVIMLDMIRAALEKGSRIIFCCERRILVDQFSKHLDAIGVDHGILMAKHWRYRPHAQVQVASIQTLERMDSWPSCDIVFLDELHACMRKSVLSMITARPDLRIVGATATPFHPAIAEHFSNIANVITMRELVDTGFLVPFRVFIAHEVDTRGVKVVAGEWQKDELESRALQIVGDVVTDYQKIYHQVWGEPRKTICFSAGVAHGAALNQRFSEIGINSVQISYLDTDERKVEVLQEFAKPDSSIRMVISSDILTRGFDQSDVEHVIIARPLRKSFSTHVQMIGRGARIHAGKSFCVLQCNTGNWLRFAEDWAILYGQGAELLMDADKKARKEKTEEQKAAAKCPRCSALWPAKSDTCASCGHVRVRKNMVVAVPGELREMTELTGRPEGADLDIREKWYRQLLFYCRENGYADGWAFHKYVDRFKDRPHWRKVAEPTSPEIRDWIRHKQIAYAKRKK